LGQRVDAADERRHSRILAQPATAAAGAWRFLAAAACVLARTQQRRRSIGGNP
jgi:hypothetical protein